MNLAPHRIAYDAALEVFRAASRKFTAVTLDYRARKVNDAVYLAARAEFKKADEISDAAERAYIDACNATGNT